MIKEKETLRKKLIAERLALSKDKVDKKSHTVIKKLINSVDWSVINKAHIYTALTPVNEIDTTPLRDFLSAKWPYIEVSTSPARKDALIPAEQFDLIIVPVLGFDEGNYRLGMGGGWYDRFLARQTKARTVGLAYSEALVQKIPIEPHDIALQKIITDNGT